MKNVLSKVMVVALIATIALVNGCRHLPEGVSEVNVAYSLGLNIDPGEYWPDSKLEKNFIKYWSLRFGGAWEEAYAMEAPYFQMMVGPSRYQQYLINVKKVELKGIKLKEMSRSGKNLYLINCMMKIRKADGKITNTFIRDRWISLDGEWLHVVKDYLFFNEAS